MPVEIVGFEDGIRIVGHVNIDVIARAAARARTIGVGKTAGGQVVESASVLLLKLPLVPLMSAPLRVRVLVNELAVIGVRSE